MAPGRDKKSGAAVGFAGLSSLVSEVDGLIAKVTARANARPSHSKSDISSTANRAGEGAQVSAVHGQRAVASSRRAIRWILGTAAAVIALWLIAIASDQSSSAVPSTTPAPRTGGPDVTVASPLSAPASSSQPVENSGVSVPAVSGSQEVSQASPDSSTEQMPPVGTGIALGASQIRYCLAEKIRLEAVRDIVRAESAVDQFNAMVDDYNGRCGNYRYSPQVFESVQQSVQANKAMLQAEGVARVRR